MAILKQITCATNSILFDEVSLLNSETVFVRLWMSVFYRHFIGEKPNFGVTLSEDKQKSISPCGGTFAPSTHLAVGKLSSVTEARQFPFGVSNDPELELNCGISLDISQRFLSDWRPAPPRLDPRNVKPGAWVAALGNVYVDMHQSASIFPSLKCKLLYPSIIDMHPSSSHFGTIVKWRFGDKLPHDPDILPFPSVFITLRLD